MKLLALLLFALPVGAADLSVLGFTLGQPLNLPECPYRMSGTMKIYGEVPAQTCVREAAPLKGYASPQRMILFGTSEAPPIVKNWRAVAFELDGRLVGLWFATPGATAQETVLAQLTAKYGPPTWKRSDPVQNLMGAAFNSVSAQWRGHAVDVSFDGTTGRLDTGQVTVDLPEVTVRRRTGEEAPYAAERKL